MLPNSWPLSTSAWGMIVSEYTADELAADSFMMRSAWRRRRKQLRERQANSGEELREQTTALQERPANPRLVSDVLQGQSVLPFPAASSGAQFRRQLMPSRTIHSVAEGAWAVFRPVVRLGHYRSRLPEVWTRATPSPGRDGQKTKWRLQCKY